MVTEIKYQNRNASLDLARLSALFCVVSVHFFLYTGFYAEPCSGWKMYLLCLLRCSFMVCIPVFLLLTGYLLVNRQFNRQHYLGVDKILGVYVLCAVTCVLVKKYYFGLPDSSLFDVFNFSASTYGWYVEMYLGLYLLVPLLNLIWRGLNGKQQKQMLLAVFLLLAHLPSVVNSFDWQTPGAFADPALTQRYYLLFPRYWTATYPISYYFIGAYLREYPLRLSKPKNALLYGAALLAFGSFAFYKSGSGVFISGPWQNWESLLLLPCGVLLFVFFVNLDASRWRRIPRVLLAVGSECVFGAYLLSCLLDKLFYEYLVSRTPDFYSRLPFYPIVFATFLLSLAASYSVTVIYTLLRTAGDALVRRMRRRERKTVKAE